MTEGQSTGEPMEAHNNGCVNDDSNSRDGSVPRDAHPGSTHDASNGERRGTADSDSDIIQVQATHKSHNTTDLTSLRDHAEQHNHAAQRMVQTLHPCQ